VLYRAGTIVLSCALSACVSLPGYPRTWAPVLASEGPCPNLAGLYTNEGEIVSKFHTVEDNSLAYNLGVLSPVDSIEVAHPSPGMLVVRAWHKGQMGQVRSYKREFGDFTCDSKWLILKSEREVGWGAGITPAWSWKKRSLGRSADGALILQEKESSVGTVILIPFGAMTKAWLRYGPLPRDN
jgi:hypothetical protein